MDRFSNEFSKEVWIATYKNYNDEKVEDNWDRISKNLASKESGDISSIIESKFKDLIYDFKFVPAGRIYANAGTE